MLDITVEPPTLVSCDDGKSDLQTTANPYGESSHDGTPDLLTSIWSSAQYMVSTSLPVTTVKSVVEYHPKVNISDKPRDRVPHLLSVMQAPLRDLQVLGNFYYGVSKDDLSYVSNIATIHLIESCASMLEALCRLFGKQTLLNRVVDFVEQVRKKGGRKAVSTRSHVGAMASGQCSEP
jgi:hypothetical protein